MTASGRPVADSRHGWLLGRVAGVPVYLGRSWPLVAAVIVLSFGPTVDVVDSRLAGYLVAFAFAVLLLASVLAHEAAHALAARHVGGRVDRVVADVWGGHTVYDHADAGPGSSAYVAVMGPAANLAVAALAYGLAQVVRGPVLSLLVGALLISNLFVAIFNLAPGLPLDGGFLVQAAVWKLTGSRATGLIVAGWLGRACTVLVGAWFVLVPLLDGQAPSLWTMVWVGLIGAFLWVGASSAIRAGSARRVVERLSLARVLRPVVTVPVHASAGTASSALAAVTAAQCVVVVDPNGRPVGFVDPQALASVPVWRLPEVPVMSLVAAPPVGWVVVADPAGDALGVTEALAGHRAGEAVKQAVVVADPSGRLVGSVSLADVEAALQVR